MVRRAKGSLSQYGQLRPLWRGERWAVTPVMRAKQPYEDLRNLLHSRAGRCKGMVVGMSLEKRREGQSSQTEAQEQERVGGVAHRAGDQDFNPRSWISKSSALYLFSLHPRSGDMYLDTENRSVHCVTPLTVWLEGFLEVTRVFKVPHHLPGRFLLLPQES